MEPKVIPQWWHTSSRNSSIYLPPNIPMHGNEFGIPGWRSAVKNSLTRLQFKQPQLSIRLKCCTKYTNKIERVSNTCVSVKSVPYIGIKYTIYVYIWWWF